MTIPKHVIVAKLRERDLDARADWVERTLPEQVDPAVHASLLATLQLDPKELAEGESAG